MFPLTYPYVVTSFLKKLLAKLFPRFLKETSLEWFLSLPDNSIGSFNELIDAFYNNFQIHMGPKITLVDLMTCKQKVDEKFTNFKVQYQMLYSQINIKILDVDLQRIFISNLQDEIQTNLEMLIFPSFT